MRIMGKRQLGELELSELIVAVLMSNIAAHPLEDIGIPLINALLPILVLLCCELLISGVALRSPRLRAFMYGRPSILVRNGKIDQTAMRKNRVSLDELAEALRSGNVTDISKIRYAILETDGDINIILNASAQPLTPETLSSVSDGGMPHIIINDGRVISDNLRLIGRDPAWLKAELRRRGAAGSRDVYYMSVDDSGAIYYAAREAEG